MMRAKVYDLCVLAALFILITIPATLADLTVIRTPPEDAAAVNVGELFTLTFQVNYSGSTDSRVAISTVFNTSGWTYAGFAATMETTDISQGFTETVLTNKVDLTNNDLAPDEGNLEVTLIFNATALGNYAFQWSSAFSILSGGNPDLRTPTGTTRVTISPVASATDSLGSSRNVFDTSEDVYIRGACFPANTDVTIYLIHDGEDAMPTNAVASSVNTTNTEGNIPITLVWAHPLTVGEYDIWVDTNQNSAYDFGDVWNDEALGISAFEVIPEFRSPIVAIIWTLTTFTALSVIRCVRKI